ncbi:MAG: N-acetyl-alpha-D-glucosaminyl L-malate synthase BshA [Ignavibacteriota bacterium]|jgi:N-acetyl-alpha-D-glucosaminyl L-malate synthase BshA|nr:MAG: N-acetyl-alpha-D-glucosaminyl L-malate synthase BshA [Ignavibacterium sp.]MBL1155896.1 N-acetyl-alpha-D-glucosaminyl L-malate synthase BshA [Ignavibacteriota bacterium]MCO6447045.1 N-acetyl-alpha-D-glucosaminyl L-malate synthase BshA [Ignavibacterium album]MCZ2267879.1 N-acetyl-alpha-D-glucosaminyl L-malate synthase BshA [Ignavibacteriales bacterium]MDX9713584.1 N-acetyl-alpha-D-glucosaminyl L-malate synthase BshA [Ignavibacteriaceae bacterium]
MKIGITCYPTYGGSGVIATELGKELALRGHEVHFISYALPFRLTKYIENIFFHEVDTTSYPLFEFPFYALSLASKMCEVAEFEKLDLLHVHYAIPHAISAFLAKQIVKNKKLKVTTTLHGTDITLVGLEPSFLPLVKFSIEQSDGVTAVSRFLKEKTLTNYYIEKEIDIIPNFVDTEIFKKVSIDDCSFKKRIAPNNEKILVHTSNFRVVKRVNDVIKIFNSVQKEIPSKLLLVGDGPDRFECERLVRELNLTDNVKFLGKQDGLVEILSSSDLFLIPSQSESFGLAALEAMACGLPVISSSVGGLPELVKHNECGFISEIGDTDRMAKYSLDLLTNEKKYEVFSQNARSRAVSKFDKSIIVPMYEEHYKNILSV